MASANKVILLGNLGADPELRSTSDGKSIAAFSLATNSYGSLGADGKRKQYVEWHRVVAFGKLADVCGKYLKKGRTVYLEGRLHNWSWEDDQGIKRSSTQVVVQVLQMVGRGSVTLSDEDLEGEVETSVAATEEPSDEPLPF